MPPINLFCGPAAHATKWTVVVDRPRAARQLTLFDTRDEAHAEIIRLREHGVAHVFALSRPAVIDQPSRLPWSERPDLTQGVRNRGRLTSLPSPRPQSLTSG